MNRTWHIKSLHCLSRYSSFRNVDSIHVVANYTLVLGPLFCSLPERIVYDDACHLKKFCTNPVPCNIISVSKKLADLDMVVDKMHFRNHVDRWCKSNCNPYDRQDLDGVNKYLYLWGAVMA